MEEGMASLPKELLYEILLLVPVVELIELKLVCKFWFRLITGTDFAESHLRRRCGISQSGFVLSVQPKMFGAGDFYYLSLDSNEFRIRKLNHAIAKCLHDNYQISSSQVYCSLLQSFHGLLLLKMRSPGSRCMTNFLVWNPVTGSSMLVPSCTGRNMLISKYYHEAFITYNPSVHRYKLVSISRKEALDKHGVFVNCYVIELFGGKQPSAPWKELMIPPEVGEGRVEASLSKEGKVQWLILMNDRWQHRLRLLTLDLATDKFKVVDCPPVPFPGDRFCSFFECNGTFYGANLKVNDGLDKWMLEDFVKPRWSMRPVFRILPSFPFSESYMPNPRAVLDKGSKLIFFGLSFPKRELSLAVDEAASGWRTIPLSFEGGTIYKNPYTWSCVCHDNSLVSLQKGYGGDMK